MLSFFCHRNKIVPIALVFVSVTLHGNKEFATFSILSLSQSLII